MSRLPRYLVVLMAIAIGVSIVHYLDNTVNYADYPQPAADSNLPAPSDVVVGGAWFFFTFFGVLGLWLLASQRVRPAAVALAIYSGSGLVGIAHYLVPGATEMPWWRQAHVVADIVCGFLVFAYAIWLARRPALNAR